MDQIRIGQFLKALRKEKGLTQEKLAETLGVSNRTVSRWETGASMPDFDLLIELAKAYGVGVEEILNGERRNDTVDKQMEESFYKVAEYTNQEKEKLMKKLHIFAWIGVAAELVYLGLEFSGLADSGIWEQVASFAAGLACGVLVVAVIYTSRWIGKFQRMKKRILQRSGMDSREA